MVRFPRKLPGGGQDRQELPSPPPPSSRDSTEDPWAWPAAFKSLSLMLHIGTSKPVAGEAQHQTALRRAAGPLGPFGPRSPRRQLVVQLALDDDPRGSLPAVRVALNGETLAHVPSARLDDYLPLLDWAGSVGHDVVCRAHLVGGYARGNNIPAPIGIYLNHCSPPVVQHHGPPPTLAESKPDLWGDWTDIDVHGGSHHPDFLAKHRFRMNVAELVVDDHGLVQIELDGTRIGHLTSKMSDRYRPGLIRESATVKSITAYCKVWPGPHRFEVTVKLPEREALAVWEMGL